MTRWIHRILLALASGAVAVSPLPGEPRKLDETLRVPAEAPGPGAAFAVFLSGDGGWAELDREVARRLAAADVPVVGWDSRAYYWTRRTPEEASADLARVLARFRQEWSRPNAILIGYSRGADVLPFLVSRLPADERPQVLAVALLGPSQAIDFEFHLSDYLSDKPAPNARLVVPEVTKLRTWPLLVIFGEKDGDSCVADFPRDLGRIELVPGDHHFGRDYDRLSRLILESAGIVGGAATNQDRHGASAR